MINKQQLKELVEHVLKGLGMYSPAAVNLLMGTAAQESQLGTYIKQLNGPARGIYQMEPATEDDIWRNYIAYRPDIRQKIDSVSGRVGPGPWLWYDLAYQTAMARIHYLRVPEPLPNPDDVEGLARYWKNHYNTGFGLGVIEQFVSNYQRLL